MENGQKVVWDVCVFFLCFDCGAVFRSKKFHVPRHEVQTLQDSEPELQSYSVTDFG